jgi:hypothetical protein
MRPVVFRSLAALAALTLVAVTAFGIARFLPRQADPPDPIDSAPPDRAGPGDAEAVKDLLDKVIAAHGGAKRLERLKEARYVCDGKIKFLAFFRPVKMTIWFQLPDHLRVEVANKGQTVLQVWNGKKGWTKTGNGEPEDWDNDQLKAQRKDFFLFTLIQTLLPLRGKDVTLRLAGETKVNDRPAVVLKGKHTTFGNFTVCVDRETHLLVKAEAQGADGRMEVSLQDYKESDGLKVWGKRTNKLDGSVVMELLLKEAKYDPLDPKLFRKP